MEKDERLEAVMKIARADDWTCDPRWEALASGSISAADREALEVEAGVSDEARERFEAFRPLDEAARARITARALAALDEPPAPEASAAPGPVDELPVDGAPPPRKGTEPKPDAVAPSPAIRRRGFSTLVLAVAGLVMASVLVIAVGDMRSDPPLPEYALAVTAEHATRGEPPAAGTEPARLGPGSRLEITIRPETRAEGAIAVRAFLVRDGSARPWPVEANVAEGGAARIAGTKETLFPGVAEGRWEMVIAIGRPGALPEAAAVLSRVEPRGYRLFHRAIVLRDKD